MRAMLNSCSLILEGNLWHAPSPGYAIGLAVCEKVNEEFSLRTRTDSCKETFARFLYGLTVRENTCNGYDSHFVGEQGQKVRRLDIEKFGLFIITNYGERFPEALGNAKAVLDKVSEYQGLGPVEIHYPVKLGSPETPMLTQAKLKTSAVLVPPAGWLHNQVTLGLFISIMRASILAVVKGPSYYSKDVLKYISGLTEFSQFLAINQRFKTSFAHLLLDFKSLFGPEWDWVSEDVTMGEGTLGWKRWIEYQSTGALRHDPLRPIVNTWMHNVIKERAKEMEVPVEEALAATAG